MRKFNLECMQIFANYLHDIDDAISMRLLRRIPPYETTLTDELLACLDSDARAREAWGATQKLQDDLTKLTNRLGVSMEALSVPTVDFKVRAYDHSRGFESKISNVDVGLLVEFGERGGDCYSRKIYLLQAKKLGHNRRDTKKISFGANSEFRSMKSEQRAAMRYYEIQLNLDVFRYMYYMPPRSNIGPELCGKAIARTWHDFFGRCGIWIGRVADSMIVDPAAIYRAHGLDTAPLMAIILGHIAQS